MKARAEGQTTYYVIPARGRPIEPKFKPIGDSGEEEEQE